MQFFAVLALLPAAALAGITTSLSYDPVYSNPSTSTLSLACSDGNNGLHTKGFATLGAVPKFPMVAAAPDIAGWNSANCGTCYKLYYKGTGKSVYVTGVDVGHGGFVGSQQVVDTLTNNRAVEVGRISVDYAKVASNLCGF